MQVKPANNLKDVLIITPEVFEDHRGKYIETFNQSNYTDELYDACKDFVQDDISISHNNVLRGIHGDSHTWKLVSCIQGLIYLVVVCNDPDSPDYRKWHGGRLVGPESSYGYTQILIPPKYGNGHLILSETAIFHYKQSTYYNEYPQFTIPWNDPELKIDWPLSDAYGHWLKPITSERDKGLDLGWLYQSGALYDGTPECKWR